MRRHVLAVALLAVLALLAGCSAAGSLELHPVDDASLAERASRDVPDDGIAGPDSERSPGAVVRSAVENGSTTVTGLSPPVTRGLPFAYRGAYYALSHAAVSEQSATVVGVAVDYNASNATGTAVPYSDLPEPDREALGALLPPRDGHREPGTDVGVGATYTEAELNQSVLAPAQEYDAVLYEGERYPVTVEDPREATVTTYRYTATRVAPNASAYAAHLREAYAFTLEGLPDAQQSVVEAATKGTYYADSTDDDAFVAVVDRFRAHDAVAADGESGTWVVRYRGTLYVAELRYGAFDE